MGGEQASVRPASESLRPSVCCTWPPTAWRWRSCDRISSSGACGRPDGSMRWPTASRGLHLYALLLTRRHLIRERDPTVDNVANIESMGADRCKSRAVVLFMGREPPRNSQT